MNWEASLPRNLHLHQQGQLKCGTKKQHHLFSFTQLRARDGAIRNGNAGWFSFPSQHNTTALWACDPARSKSIGAQGRGLRACTGLRRSAAGVWRLSLPLRVKNTLQGKQRQQAQSLHEKECGSFFWSLTRGLKYAFQFCNIWKIQTVSVSPLLWFWQGQNPGPCPRAAGTEIAVEDLGRRIL